ncbi:MAG: GGDEF domain-containing protein [Oleiphilaceae bacterium]|nr:GGDEF domain-containing protein [Oleiphilaceae bacterium]
MQQAVLARIDEDLDKRSINGSYAYIAAWLLIGFSTDFAAAHAVIFWSISAALLVLGIFRFVLKWLSPRIRTQKRALWLFLFLINALVPSTIYSTLFSLSFIDPVFEPLFLYLLLAIFAFVSGGVINFSPNRLLLFSYLMSLVLPPLFTSLVISDKHFTVGALMTVYAVFMFAQSVRLNRDYQQLVKQQVLLEEINNQDSLTGIGNRRFFDESMSRIWKSQLRHNDKVGLLLLDIDHFKIVNDTHGHAAGDEVIKVIAECIQQSCQRETDVIARIGGEEFAVLIASGEREVLKGLGEKIRFLVEATRVHYGAEKLKVTISVGGAVLLPSLETSPDDLFKLADRCLYTAKESGRNRVIVTTA